MDKHNVMDSVFRSLKYTKEQRQILEALEDAKEEWKIARDYFELIDDPKLIDYAIYKEQAAEARYIYLLNEAKNKNIKVNSYFIIVKSGVV